jgi:hypothetical protein
MAAALFSVTFKTCKVRHVFLKAGAIYQKPNLYTKINPHKKDKDIQFFV